MRQSQLFYKTSKEFNGQELSKNAQLLTRAGYINKLSGGIYNYMPLGLRTLNKIENLIRDYMHSVDSQEVMMPVLQPREIWDKTKRWEAIDVMYKIRGHSDKDYALSPTNEEVATPFVASFITSYKDLPKSIFQIQNKFRDEPRAKSGLFRCKEFRMKDMYSFHTSQGDLDAYYDKATKAYLDFYADCGLAEDTYLTYASGGAFSKYSHEFQTITDSGEDTIYIVPGTKIAINKEIIEDKLALMEIIPNYTDGIEKTFEVKRAVEVGNIFKLGTRFTDAFGATYTDKDGASKPIIMGCYGIGPSRVLGTVAEVLSDDKGLIWPEKIAPFEWHLISLANKEPEIQQVEQVYTQLTAAGFDILYYDRPDVRGGMKFAESDLIGIPNKIIAGKTLSETGKLEVKNRRTGEVQQMNVNELIQWRLLPRGKGQKG